MSSIDSGISVIDWEACTGLGSSWNKTKRRLRAGKIAYDYHELHGIEGCFSRADIDSTEHPRIHELTKSVLNKINILEIKERNESLGMVVSTSKGAIGNHKKSSIVGLGNPGIWSSEIASNFDSVDQVSSPNTACATGLTALIQGCRWIQDGEVNQALIIASESCFYPLMLGAYKNLGVLCSEQGMRPFHPDRDGFALGEASALVWIMDTKTAQEKNIKTRCKIDGWGESSDAYHMTKMEQQGQGLWQAIQSSLNRSRVSIETLDLIHAHLTTTPDNDSIEREVISKFPDSPILQGIKPALGHTIGASGLLEFIATIETLSSKKTFPIVNSELDYVPYTQEIPGSLSGSLPRYGMTWNMGFGGHNACIIAHAD